MKTPEQIAEEALAAASTEEFFGRDITQWMTLAIEADRTQRPEEAA